MNLSTAIYKYLSLSTASLCHQLFPIFRNYLAIYIGVEVGGDLIFDMQFEGRLHLVVSEHLKSKDPAFDGEQFQLSLVLVEVVS